MGRRTLILLLVAPLLGPVGACHSGGGGGEQCGRDAAPAAVPGARLAAPPQAPLAPIIAIGDEHGRGRADELGPDGRLVAALAVACPVADKLALDPMLDEAARRYEQGDFVTALACAERAVTVDPRNVEAHHDRAIALAALARWDAAKQAFTLALAIDPDDPETLAGAADFYINRLATDRELTEIGLELARRGSAKAGRRRGDNPLASRLALLEAQALDDLARSDDALPRAEDAVVLDPSNLDARYEKAVILFHLCKFERARLAFADLLARAPDDPFAHHHLGLILEREGRIADAEAHFARAHALTPEKFPPAVMLSRVEFQRLVDTLIKELDSPTQKLIVDTGVAIEVADLPALEDLTAVDPPFAPTILGLYRGAPVGAAGQAGVDDEARAIVLYRKNLGRAVGSLAELEKQVRITLWHEIGHLKGRDEDDLRARGLE